MHIIETYDPPVSGPDKSGTIWRCDWCDSFVSIHCAKPVKCAICPTCAERLLEFYGTFEGIIARHLTDDKSN